jgi:carboxymethylenebutenolidase
MERTVGIDVAGTPMDLYEVEPVGAARGAVIVVQEAFGVTDHIEDVCRRFADAGYRAVAPHLFHRSGDPVIGYDEMDKVIPHIMELKADDLLADLDATIDRLGEAGFEPAQIGIVGFCMGGSVVFLAAARRSLGAGVTFYGGGVSQGRFGMPPLVELATELKTPWLGLFGDADQSIPVADVEALRAAVAGARVPAEIVRYPGADHGFHCDARSSYHEASAKDGWKRTLDWFGSHLRASQPTAS